MGMINNQMNIMGNNMMNSQNMMNNQNMMNSQNMMNNQMNNIQQQTQKPDPFAGLTLNNMNKKTENNNSNNNPFNFI
jgi:hypothetical protein